MVQQEIGCNEEIGGIKDLRLDDYYLHFTLLVAVLVVTSFFMELILHFVSKYVSQTKHRHVTAIVNCVYKELMVLGVVGAMLFVVNEVQLLDFTLGTEHNNEIVVEFVHVMIFMIGILYIMLVGFALVILIQKTFKSWKALEHLGEELVTGLKQNIQQTPQNIITRYLFKTNNQVYYYELRKRFLEYNDLPDDFDFARYLRKCMREKIMLMLHIDKYMWGVLLIMVFFNAIRRAVFGEISQHGSVIFGVGLGWSLLLVSAGILVYCTKILGQLGTYANLPIDHAKLDVKVLFVLHRPNLLLKILQIATFLQAFYLALFLLALGDEIVEEYPGSVSWLIILSTISPPFISVVVFIPQILPLYVLCSSTYNMSDEELIESTFKEVLKKKRMTILGFSASRSASRELKALQLDTEKYSDSYKATLYGEKKGWKGRKKADNAVALNIISDNNTMFAPLLSNAQ